MDETKQPLDWDAVYWDYMPRILNYFRYQVGDNALAEDLTSTTFVKAWKARADYNRARGVLSTWLFTIARNTMTDHYRRARQDAPLDDVRLPISEERPVEAAQERQQDFAQLSLLMGQLSPRDRELIALKYGADMTNRAIASIMAMTESNVGTTLYRAVKWLRSAWEVKTNG